MVLSLLEACYNLCSALQTYLKHTSHLTESLQDIFKGPFTIVNEAFCGLGIDSDAYGVPIPKLKPLCKAAQLLISQSVIHSLKLLR